MGAIWALGLGHVIGLGLFILTQMGIWPRHFTINVGIMAGISTVIFVVARLRTAAPDRETVDRMTWAPGTAAAAHREEGNEPADRGPGDRHRAVGRRHARHLDHLLVIADKARIRCRRGRSF